MNEIYIKKKSKIKTLVDYRKDFQLVTILDSGDTIILKEMRVFTPIKDIKKYNIHKT